MPKAFNQAFQIHRDQRLVLDDKNIRRKFGRKLPAGLFNKIKQRRGIYVEDSSRLFFGKSFDGDQQERLAWLGGYLGEAAFRGEVTSYRIGNAINGQRIPDC
jgi:hypothetical protein